MSLGSVQVLNKSLQEAKKSLEGTNETILRMSGRDPNRSKSTSQTDKSHEGGHMRTWSDDYSPAAKRRTSSNFKRIGLHDDFDAGDDDSHPNFKLESDTTDTTVNLKSSVSTAPVPPRPNIDATSDTTSKQRNRRMFGMLMGTLQKFQKDSVQVTEQEKRRVQIENKLEEVAFKEREEAAKQKKMLLDQRKTQRQIVGRLTNQLASAELYEEWNSHDKKLIGFIKTTTQPSIFYLPSIHNETTEATLDQSNTALNDTITARQNEIELLLQENVLLVSDQSEEQILAPEEEDNPHTIDKELLEQ